MREAGLVVWHAHQAAAALVKPGATTREIDAAIENYFVERGAVPLFKGVPGKVPFPAVTCISVNEEVVHGIPGPRKLVEGDVVSIDTGCKLNGWCGDAAVTRPVGRISAENQRLLDVTKGTLDLAIELMKVKGRWSDVAAEMEKYVRDAGFYVVETFVGHGIGREMHEEPTVFNWPAPEATTRLIEGMVFTIEPMLGAGRTRLEVRRDGWTVRTADRSLSAHAEHTVMVASGGAVVLTTAG
jgi:methionyl aminopeptidase